MYAYESGAQPIWVDMLDLVVVPPNRSTGCNGLTYQPTCGALQPKFSSQLSTDPPVGHLPIKGAHGVNWERALGSK